MRERLYRSREDRMVSGVCGGLAEYFAVDAAFVRVIAVILLAVGNVATVVAYLVMAVVVPERPSGGEGVWPLNGEPTGEQGQGTGARFAPGTTPAGYPPPPPVPPIEPASRRWGGAGVTAGAALILLGIAVMAGRWVGGLGASNMWPLVIVAIGAAQILTPGKEGWGLDRVVEGLSTVAFGSVLFGCTIGLIGWDVWWSFATLWPVLLVALGLAIISRSVHAAWVGAMSSLVVIAALSLAAWTSWSGMGLRAWPTAGEGEEFSLSESVGAVETATLGIDAGAGDFTIGDGPALVTASGRIAGGSPSFSVSRFGTDAEVRFGLPGHGGPWVWRGGSPGRTDLTLSDRVFWRDVRVNTGMSSLTADLTDLEVGEVILNSGMSDTTLLLGDVPDLRREASVLVKTGFANVHLEFPGDAEVRVVSDSGFAPVTVDGRLEKVSGGWQTARYDEARRRGDGVWLVEVKTGFGAVRVALR